MYMGRSDNNEKNENFFSDIIVIILVMFGRLVKILSD